MADHVRRATLRLAGCVLFLPLAVPFIVIAPSTLLAAGLAWLILGWREEDIDACLLNPALRWADDLPLWLFRAATAPDVRPGDDGGKRWLTRQA
jgi:hypothetical protein